MVKPLNKAQLIQEITVIDRRQQGPVFSQGVIEKILGVSQPWRTLKKDQLIQVLAAWHDLLASCPKTAHWETIVRGDRQVCLLADGQPWVDYFGFPSRNSAQRFLDQVLPHCQWAIVRPSGKRVNASFECKVWGLTPDSLEAIAPQGREEI